MSDVNHIIAAGVLATNHVTLLVAGVAEYIVNIPPHEPEFSGPGLYAHQDVYQSQR